MKKIIILAVLTVMLVSGCIDSNGPITTSGNGLDIIEFEIQPETVRANSNVYIKALLKNNGENSVDKEKGFGRLIISNDWKNGNQFITDNDIIKAFPDRQILAATPQREAGIAELKWSLKAPELSRGQTRTDTISVRVYYDYKTDANGIVYVYPDGEEIEETTSFKSDNAPIQLDVYTIPDAPEVVDEDFFTLIITAKNVGGGRVYKPGLVGTGGDNTETSLETGAYDTLTISVKTPDNSGLEIPDECLGDLELFGTPEQGNVQCDINIERPDAKKPYSMVVTAEYGYYTESTSNIVITGSPN